MIFKKSPLRASRQFAVNCFAALILASCSIQPVTHRDSLEEEKDFEVVDWSGNDVKETIVIKNRPEGDYGPLPETEAPSEDGEKAPVKEPVVAVDLYPALYNSLGYVSTFVELENSGVNVSIVSSSGFSAIIAALYAKHGASNMVEWKTFELYQLLGDSVPFQSEWNGIIKEFLSDEFGDLKLSQLKKLLVVPRLEGGKTVLDTNQKVVDAIWGSLNFAGNSSSILVGGDFDYLGALRKYGADEVMRVSFLPGKISLKRPNGFVFGVYSKLAGKKSKSASTHEFIFGDALKGEIDSFKNLSDAIYQTKEENKLFAKRARDLLDKNLGQKPSADTKGRIEGKKSGKI